MERIAKEILKDVALEDVTPKPRTPRNPVDHWSPAILLERAAYLRKMAKLGDGSASETLKDYPKHCAMLSFRSRDGEAEVHERFADLFVVLSGAATLVTGGVVAGASGVVCAHLRFLVVMGGNACIEQYRQGRGFIPGPTLVNRGTDGTTVGHYCAASARASRWTNVVNTSALTSDTASQSMPEPVAWTTLKPRMLRCAGSDRAADSGRTKTSIVCRR